MTLHEDLELCVPQLGPLRAYLEWAVQTTDAEHLFHLGSVLPCIANEVVSSGFVVEEARRLKPTAWSFLVGVPAGSKSTTQKTAQKFYKNYLNTRAAREVPDPFVIAEGSWPGIFEALAERFDPELGLSSGIVVRDEAARLLENGRDTTIADALCNMIDGDEVKRHLRGAREQNRANPGAVKDTMRAPAFSGCLATTFARIREVTQASYIEGGLYSRFLWFVGGASLPEPILDVNPHDSQRRRVLDEWLEWGKWLLGMQMLKERDERLVTFAPEADELLRSTLFASLREHCKNAEDRMNATRKRGLTQAKIVAGIYALTQQRTIVEYDDMLAAVNLVELSTHGLETLSMKFIPSAAARDPITLADKAFSTIRAKGAEGCTRATLYQALSCPKNVLEGVIDTLIDEGAIAATQPPKPVGPGRPPTAIYHATRKDRYGSGPTRAVTKRHLRLVTDSERPPESVPEAPQPLDGSDEPK